MFPGAFKEVYCKCGKKNCWCYKQKGHPFRRIIWSENGRSKTMTIPAEDVDWIKQVTENYCEFRRKCKEIKELQDGLKTLLDEYGKDILKKSTITRLFITKIEIHELLNYNKCK
jgi:hypothetical protein